MSGGSQQSGAAQALARLNAAAEAVGRDIAFMEVCGTHTVSAFRCGLHSLMPDNVKLLSGPGCPVCVTSQGDVDMFVALGELQDVTICTYGDMLNVPGSNGSLEQARSQGADVRVIYSTMDVIKWAEAEPEKQFVLAAVGFETTAPATAAAVMAAQAKGLTNFSALVSHKLVIPAMLALLGDGRVKLDGFLCPGHVGVIIGNEAYRPVVEAFGLPCVSAGFEPEQIAEGLARLTELVRDEQVALENLYTQVVTDKGNPIAQQIIDKVFEPTAVNWRALGVIEGSGLKLRDAFAAFDAQKKYELVAKEAPEPAGCRCGEVITGRCTPGDCSLFGNVCTPINPIGPCMVSSEGTCQAWFKYRR